MKNKIWIILLFLLASCASGALITIVTFADTEKNPAEPMLDLEAQPPLPWIFEIKENWRVAVVDTQQLASGQWATIYLEQLRDDGNWYFVDGESVEMGEFLVEPGSDNPISFQNNAQQKYTLKVSRSWAPDLECDIIVVDPNSSLDAGIVCPQ